MSSERIFEPSIVDVPSEISRIDSFVVFSEDSERRRPSVNFPRSIVQYAKVKPELTYTEATSLDSVSFADVYLEPQEEGGFVAFSKEFPGAVGQGETDEEAIRDLQKAVELLKEVLDEDTISK